MNLLLTSAGITNNKLASIVKELVADIRIAFIPTAANVEEGGKDWLIKNFVECQELGPVDIVDISALTKEQWLPRLKAATVIVVGGGNTLHLMSHITSSGLTEELPRLLNSRLYIGISAGSIVTNSTLIASSEYLFTKKEAPKGLGLTSVFTVPHLNSPYFPKTREENLRDRQVPGTLYALDDDSAILIQDNAIKLISEGTFLKLD